jgi:hypothetical protein
VPGPSRLLGTGITTCYPAENQALAEAITASAGEMSARLAAPDQVRRTIEQQLTLPFAAGR